MRHLGATSLLCLFLPASLAACGQVAGIDGVPDAGIDVDAAEDGSGTGGYADAHAEAEADADAEADAEADADAGADAEADAGADADADAGADAEADADARTDAPVPIDAGRATSCLDAHQRDPTAPSGVYPIVVDGQNLDVYCDMTLSQGGWTAFYSGTLGARNVFAHFDRGGLAGSPPDECSDPANRCLRHLPSVVTLATSFAVACGPNAVGFSATTELLAYLGAGTPASWLTLGSPVALTPSAHAEWATYFWTGGQDPQGASDGNLGWIVSNGAGAADSDREHTFASAYDSRSWGWDYCNGTDYNDVDASAPAGGGTPGPTVRLFYR